MGTRPEAAFVITVFKVKFSFFNYSLTSIPPPPPFWHTGHFHVSPKCEQNRNKKTKTTTKIGNEHKPPLSKKYNTLEVDLQ